MRGMQTLSLVSFRRYLSNTNVKFMAITDEVSLKDDVIHKVSIEFSCLSYHEPTLSAKVLLGLHSAYVDAMCNPFFSLPIKSQAFDRTIEQLLSSV